MICNIAELADFVKILSEVNGTKFVNGKQNKLKISLGDSSQQAFCAWKALLRTLKIKKGKD
jgi:hypothetical protein